MTAVQDRQEPGPVPEAPNVTNVDPRVIRDQIKALNRQKRDARIKSTTTTLRTLHRGYYYAGGAVVGVTLVGLAAVWMLRYQRDTTLALADLRARDTPATTEPAPVVQSGIPNPLEALEADMAAQAAYNLGANVQTNDNGERVGLTPLPPLRSAAVLGQLLESVDLCNVYLSLNDVAQVIVTFEPTPGATPLIDPALSSRCAPAATTVPVPTDPIPPTVPTVATVPAS